jgi:hypothetical protein
MGGNDGQVFALLFFIFWHCPLIINWHLVFSVWYLVVGVSHPGKVM